MSDEMLKAGLALERQVRHLRAATKSDHEFLLNNLADAAKRFSDLADLLDRGEATNGVASFMRASAERYRAVTATFGE